jgi:serine/threonine-protein kinase
MRRTWTCEAGVTRRTRGRSHLGECPLDREIEAIVLKALAKGPQQRYQSAGELARDIRHYLRGEPIEARSDALLYVLWKQSRRYFRRRPAVLLALLCAILAPGLVISIMFWREAVRERDVAEAAIGFLNSDVFLPLDPAQAGRAVDLKKLLDAAAGKLDVRFADAPLAEASIRHTLGNLYTSIGENEQARFHLERALQVRRTGLGANHPAIAESLVSLARALEGLGRLTAAEENLQSALALRTARLGPDHEMTQETLAELAAFARRRGDLERAAQLDARSAAGSGVAAATATPVPDEARVRERLANALRQYGDDHPEVAARLVDVADVLTRQGDHEKAESLYVEAMRVWTAQFGPEHPRVHATFAKLEALLVSTKRTDRAVPLLAARLERARAQTGNAELLSSAAWDVVKQPHYPSELNAAALHAAEEACRLDPQNGSYANTLGVALYRVGRYAEALDTLKHSDRLNGGHPADVAFLAMAHARIGQIDSARREMARLRTALEREPWASDRQSQRFLEEAQMQMTQLSDG